MEALRRPQRHFCSFCTLRYTSFDRKSWLDPCTYTAQVQCEGWAEGGMLGAFVSTNREEIIAGCTFRNGGLRFDRDGSPLHFGVPLFLDELVAVLGAREADHSALISTARQHAAELWHNQMTVAQVVRDYGSVCQTISELATERDLVILPAEFKTLNLCLDDAIAEAVTEFGRLQEEAGNERLDQLTADRMASVGMLAAGIVHEINNPLTAVIANLALAIDHAAELDEGKLQHTQALKDELRDSLSAAERIRHVVRNVRVFSACSGQKRHLVELEPILESSLRLASNELRHRARLIRDYAAELRPVEADASQLGQVFLNLLVNAAQSIEEGHAATNEISVVMRMMGELVVVEIRDSGVGMPAEVLPRLFTPFFTTTEAAVGTGLGLSICHRIVTELGGSISVESTPGRGSVFRVSLPAAKAGPLGRAAEAEETAAPSHRGRILIIDDEVLIGKATCRILAGQHEVTATTSGQEALEWIAAGRSFDVILCDLMMPNLTGQEFYAELRSTNPKMAEKIIFMTGGAFTLRASHFLSEVTNPRLDKPFDSPALRNAVNRAIGLGRPPAGLNS